MYISSKLEVYIDNSVNLRLQLSDKPVQQQRSMEMCSAFRLEKEAVIVQCCQVYEPCPPDMLEGIQSFAFFKFLVDVQVATNSVPYCMYSCFIE